MSSVRVPGRVISIVSSNVNGSTIKPFASCYGAKFFFTKRDVGLKL